MRHFPQQELNYLVEIAGEPKPSHEINQAVWVSWQEIKTLPLPINLYKELLTKLHNENRI